MDDEDDGGWTWNNNPNRNSVEFAKRMTYNDASEIVLKRQGFDFTQDKNAEWRIYGVVASFESGLAARLREDEKKAALAKLTQREKTLLGLKD